MKVEAITVNAAEMMAERQSIPGNGLQVQAESNHMFAPECKVTISREGRNLSRQWMVQAESNVQNTKSAAAESNPSAIRGEMNMKDLQFSQNESSEEAMEALNELAQKAVKLEDVVIDPSRAQDLIQAAQDYQEYKA